MRELVEETTQKVRTDVLVESYGDKSIAVLPFVNMSDDAGNEYFSDGISEELLNLLVEDSGNAGDLTLLILYLQRQED